GPALARAEARSYPPTPRIPVADTLHGTVIVDDYRWLENAGDAAVGAWTAAQDSSSRSILDRLPERDWLRRRFESLWRYDDEGAPEEVIDGDRFFYWVKRKEDEKSRYWTKASREAPGMEVLDPNAWGADDQLEGFYPSRDGRYVAFGRAHAGDETPVVRVMEVETGRILPDSLRGWRPDGVSWLPDGSGFYYSANPGKGEVPAGEEVYWSRAYFHRLGAPAASDSVVFFHPSVKEYFHAAWVSEDGLWVLYGRWEFSKNELYFQRLGSKQPPIPLATGFDAQYSAQILDGRIYVTTDSGASMSHVFLTDVDHPERASWKEIVPEDPERKIEGVVAIGGRLYLQCERRASTEIRIHDADGRWLRDLPLPGIGSASVSGHWSKPTVWVSFSSFVQPPVTYTYDFAADSIRLYKKFPVDVDVSPYTVDQVFYPSKDGTRISMFLAHRKDLARDGRGAALLTGYGGFDVSITPHFSASLFAWLEAGAVVALPNLRGGGEYGRAWHEAGMLERKQNVFDDFLSAAEWLIAQGYTSRERLAISGGSNGGLLVGAAMVQRPDLFRAVLCEVPLLDMLRYHLFGYANIWASEYGNAENADQFAFLRAYSPYHNVRDGVRYPAALFIASDNDARVDALHARKMAARLQAADAGGGPILFLLQGDSGHGGAVSLSEKIEQAVDGDAFLMDQVGVRGPVTFPESQPH
ncbi:MAG: prolyl oligopeptidase family serine peptidase, partial [Candidatus Eisenbacteria bacterium]|nr:prolyl oligopeptidase family serine peptidase [Candidatus Eisenbacteria bacterium]